MATLLQDLRFALRTLAKSPVFTVVALLSLALGIGANTAIFSLIDQVLLRLLPVKNAAELVVLNQQGADQGRISSRYEGSGSSFSYPMYRDIRDRNPVFNGVLARFGLNLSMTWRGQTERVDAELVSGNYFQVLGVQTVLGRAFTADDDRAPGAGTVVILSHGFWSRRFAASPEVLGQTLRLNGHPMTIIGVAPPRFSGVGVGEAPDVFVPMTMKAQMTPGWDDLQNRRSMWLNIFARLKPGVSQRQAEVGINTFWHPILEQELKDIPNHSERFRRAFLAKHLSLLPGGKGISGFRTQAGAPLLVLMAMVGLVLLIACANVANLMIARAAARQKEIAVRLALGAGRLRLVRQLLVESVVLALGGGALGILVASWTSALILSFLPQDDSASRAFSANPDLRVLAFAFALSLVTGILFGLVPALQATRPMLARTLQEQANNVSGAAGQARFRKFLVVSQVALSLLLLIGAGLFARSLYNLKRIDPGFRTDHLITFSIDPTLNGYTVERTRSFYAALQQDLSSLPGVSGVSMAEMPQLANSNSSSNITVDGYQAKEGENMDVRTNFVGPGYFSVLRMPLLQGRETGPRDSADGPKVAIVNETFARHFFGKASPLGRHFGFGGGDGVKLDIEIVGLVKDGKYSNLRETTPRFVFLPYTQDPGLGQISFYARSSQDPASLGTALRKGVQRLDASLPVFSLITMDRQIDDILLTERFIAVLASIFGGLATLLAAIGLYGVMAYNVARRTREIGIRMALGADRRNVIRLVMVEVGLMIGGGILIAIPVSLQVTRLIQSQLFGIGGNDPAIITGATLALAAVALLAGYLPALRATRVDPLVALRYE